MNYQVTISKPAKKVLDQFPSQIRNRLVKAAFALCGDPRPHGCIKMAGPSGEYRIKVGKYRIIYAIDDPGRRVVVRVIRHRKDVYR
jgi:mRNA interferase RelE/StbE